MDPGCLEIECVISFDQATGIGRYARQYRLGTSSWKKSVFRTAEGLLIQEGLQQIQTELMLRICFSTRKMKIFTRRWNDVCIEIIGPTAGKLHTGRSRNDQVATDFRLWVMENILQLIQAIKTLQLQMLKRAEKDMGVTMPAYTHLQRAQPVLLSHWWLSFFWALERDLQQFIQASKTSELFCRWAVVL